MKDINYVLYGTGDTTLVFLHGWGQNIEMMKPLADAFASSFQVLILDLPGFGLSRKPNKVLKISDYADIVHKLVEELNIKNPILLGHSFGGKVSLYYASIYPVKQLVIFAAPYRKQIKKETLKMEVFKGLKKIKVLKPLEEVAKKHIGSTDYKNASGIMREILVEHVNFDMEEIVKKITAPTLLIWGENDQAVSIEEGRHLESIMQDAGLVTYPGTHYTYLEYLNPVTQVLHTFLKK